VRVSKNSEGQALVEAGMGRDMERAIFPVVIYVTASWGSYVRHLPGELDKDCHGSSRLNLRQFTPSDERRASRWIERGNETSLVEVMTSIMNQTSWQVRPRTAGWRSRAIATCRFWTDATVHLNTM